MILKVCGMQKGENIREVEKLGVDLIGLIFYDRSPRFVKHFPEYLPRHTKRVGVFVNETFSVILETARKYNLQFIQLHGKEEIRLCDNIRSAGLKVIKAFPIKNSRDLEITALYEGHCDFFLFDTASPAYGGTGQSFDWTILESYTGNTPFLLSGGIGPGDEHKIRAFSHPKFAGIDLNSQFEEKPGLKTIDKLRIFLQHLKNNKDMNLINSLFNLKDRNILSVYFTAGYPHLEDTRHILRELQHQGVDMVEIGIPFSDPMADGPVIQAAATDALRNGMTLHKLFEQLENIRSEITIPIILMGYLNPIMQYGFENFCRDCAARGINGMIIPDLPFKDYLENYKPIADKYDLRIIMLITPETSDERIRFIDEHTDGFIYMVSSAAITGAQKSFNEAKQAYFKRIENMQLRNQRLIGFGISNKETFDAACHNASGAIIGSKFVELLGQKETPKEAVSELLRLIGRK